MKRHIALGALFLALGSSGSLGAQSLSAGNFFGTQADEAPNRLAWVSADLVLLQSGLLGVSFAPGKLGINWESYSTRAVWANFEAPPGEFSLGGGSLGLLSKTWAMRQGPYHFDLALKESSAQWTYAQFHSIEGGLFQVRSKADIFYLDDVDIGGLRGQIQGVFSRWSWGGAFYAWGRGSLDARVDFFVFTPLLLEGATRAQAGGFWLDLDTGTKPVNLGLFVGAAWAQLFGQRFILRQETIDELKLPVEVTASQTTWRLQTDPAWALLITPRVQYTPRPACTLEVARWLPLLGGWSLHKEPSSHSGTPSGGGTKKDEWKKLWDQLNALDPWDLWVAGTSVSVTVQY